MNRYYISNRKPLMETAFQFLSLGCAKLRVTESPLLAG